MGGGLWQKWQNQVFVNLNPIFLLLLHKTILGGGATDFLAFGAALTAM